MASASSNLPPAIRMTPRFCRITEFSGISQQRPLLQLDRCVEIVNIEGIARLVSEQKGIIWVGFQPELEVFPASVPVARLVVVLRKSRLSDCQRRIELDRP